MVIEFGEWRLVPLKSSGQRCWQVLHGKRKAALRYYSTLDAALLFCLEWDARNKVEGTYDLPSAIHEYWRITHAIEDAVKAAETRGRTGAGA